MAIIAQGTTIKIGDGGSPEVFTAVGQVRSIDGPGGAAAVIDTTTLDSVAREKAMGLADEGELSLSLVLDFNDAGQTAMRAARLARTRKNFRFEFPTSPVTVATFSGYVSEFSLSAAVDGVLEASATIIIDGPFTYV